jgi:beta-N-acetylhexosaminidase
LETDIRRADWVIVALLNVDPGLPASQALTRFLNERSDLFQQKRLVVFAFNAPYYLDATDVSRLTAYYGLYSKGPNFIDVAVRLLFRELRPSGSLPISVPGIGYDIFTATTPDPAQVIPLSLDLPQAAITPTVTLEPGLPPGFRVGDLISVRTGIILDHNGHPVPDGTQVQFIVSTNGEVTSLPQVVATRAGSARATVQVASAGNLEIRVESEPAKNSEVFQFDIPQENLPPATPTATLEPTATPPLTPSPSPTPPPDEGQAGPQQMRPHLIDWFIATLLAFLIALVCYRVAATIGQVRWGVRAAFLAFIGGLLAYTYLALELPGSVKLLDSAGSWGIVLTTIGGDLLGVFAVVLWRNATGRSGGEP